MNLTFTWTCGPLEYIGKDGPFQNVVTRIHNLSVSAEDLQNGIRLRRSYRPIRLEQPRPGDPFVPYSDVTKSVAISWGLGAMGTDVQSEEAALMSEAGAYLGEKADGSRPLIGVPWINGGDQ